MIADNKSQIELEQRIVARLMDRASVRIALGVVLAVICYRASSPFLTMMIWALILAVILYPLHPGPSPTGSAAGGGLASTLIVILGLVLIVAPSAALMGSLGDSVQQLVRGAQSNSLGSRRRATPWRHGPSSAAGSIHCGRRRMPICPP